jgi:hypothetical protein
MRKWLTRGNISLVGEMGIMNYANLRRKILETRFKQMSKPRFVGIKAMLDRSSFLDSDPMGDGDEMEWSSESSIVLKQSLKNYFDNNFGRNKINVNVQVDYAPTSVTSGPDAVLKSGMYFFDGKHNLELVMANVEDSEDLRSMGNVTQKVYEVVMHELLHMQQFMKYSRGKPTVSKWDSFMEEYEKGGGASEMGGEYFFFDESDGPSELETFSLQIAIELIDRLGQSKAVQLLQTQKPQYNVIRRHSPSFRLIEKESPGMLTRTEVREMIKRAKQYAKEYSG